MSFCPTTENAIQAFGNGSDVTMWQPAPPVQTTTATTTTAFRVKNKPLGPAGSENEIPTHVLPPCANLQVRSGSQFPIRAGFWEDMCSSFKRCYTDLNFSKKKSLCTCMSICMMQEPMDYSMCVVWTSAQPWCQPSSLVFETGALAGSCKPSLAVSFGIDLSHLRLTHPQLCLLPHQGAGISDACYYVLLYVGSGSMHSGLHMCGEHISALSTELSLQPGFASESCDVFK